jgi:hypothetical protein
VDLAYLEHVVGLTLEPSPMPYEVWFPIFTSLYTTISHSRHEGAHKLWLAFLRKGMTSLNHLIRSATPETIAAEVANRVERRNAYIVGTPEAHRSAAYWHTLSDAHRWYCNLERMLAGDAGLTQELIVELGEEMIELVCKPFEKISLAISVGEPGASDTTQSVLSDIEDAKAGPTRENWEVTSARARERVANIIAELQTPAAE